MRIVGAWDMNDLVGKYFAEQCSHDLLLYCKMQREL